MISMAERGIPIPISETKPFYTPEGHKAGPVNPLGRPEEKIQDLPNPDRTAIHEWWHTWMGMERNVGIGGVDIIRKGDAFGTTYPDRFDGPTAAAGHASGTGGHGYDFFLIEAHGMNPMAESAKARATAKGHEEEIMMGASILEEEKSLTREGANTVYTKVKRWINEREDNKTQAYEVPIKTKDGRQKTVRLEVPKGATMLHVPLPPSGVIFVAAEREISLAP